MTRKSHLKSHINGSCHNVPVWVARGSTGHQLLNALSFGHAATIIRIKVDSRELSSVSSIDSHLRRCWWPLASVGLWPIALSRLIRLCWSCLFTSVTQNSLQVNNHRDASYISGSRTASPTTLRWQFVFVDWLFGSAVAFKEHGRQAWNECIDAKMNAYCDGNRHLADRNMWELEQVL